MPVPVARDKSDYIFQRGRLGNTVPAARCGPLPFFEKGFCMSLRSAECCTQSTPAREHPGGNLSQRPRCMPRRLSSGTWFFLVVTTARSMLWIGTRAKNCGKRLAKPRCGHRRLSAMELPFLAARTGESMPSMPGVVTKNGPKAWVEGFIPRRMPLSISFTWVAETARFTLSRRIREGYCGKRLRATALIHLPQWPMASSLSAPRIFMCMR